MKKFLSLFLIFLLLFPSSGYSLFSLEEEEKLGKEILQEVSKQIEFIEDLEIGAYLEKLGEVLLRKGIKISPFRFRFFLLKDKTFNAFSVPGGYIFLNAGIFDIINTEAELVSILAHEMAHNLSRHVARRLESIKKMQLALTAATLAALILGGGEISQAVGITGAAVAETKLLAYSRADEEEADRIGFEILIQAGYTPQAVIQVMEKLSRQSSFAVALNYKYLFTHPLPSERLNYLYSLVERCSLTEGKAFLVSPDEDYFKRIKIKAKILSEEASELIPRYKLQLSQNYDPWVHYALALTLAQKRFYSEAITEMLKVLSQLPPKNYFKLDLAEIYLMAGKWEETIKILQNLNFETFNSSEIQKILYLKQQYLLARSLGEIGNLTLAYRIFKDLSLESILKNNPYFYFYFGKICSSLAKDGEAHFYFGKFYEIKGDFRTALFHYKKALSFLSKTDKMYLEAKELAEKIEKKR